jgi:hypothetical protein
MKTQRIIQINRRWRRRRKVWRFYKQKRKYIHHTKILCTYGYINPFKAEALLKCFAFHFFSISDRALLCLTFPGFARLSFWSRILLIWRCERSVNGMIVRVEECSTLDKNLHQCHSVRHVSHTAWPRIEHRPSRPEAGDWLPDRRGRCNTEKKKGEELFCPMTFDLRRSSAFL